MTSLLVFDEDSDGPAPPALFASGQFLLPGYIGPRQIAKWDGLSWHAVASFGNSDMVFGMAAFDEDGVGPLPARLYASGGTFATFLNRWDGQAWTSMSGAFWTAPLLASQRHREPALYLGGEFGMIGGTISRSVAKLIGCPRFCPGDLTGDGLINMDDLTVLLAHFGALAPALEQGDLNEDGDIDLRDLTELLSVFGQPCDH